jgi:hypothetical protein
MHHVSFHMWILCRPINNEVCEMNSITNLESIKNKYKKLEVTCSHHSWHWWPLQSSRLYPSTLNPLKNAMIYPCYASSWYIHPCFEPMIPIAYKEHAVLRILRWRQFRSFASKTLFSRFQSNPQFSLDSVVTCTSSRFLFVKNTKKALAPMRYPWGNFASKRLMLESLQNFHQNLYFPTPVGSLHKQAGLSNAPLHSSECEKFPS